MRIKFVQTFIDKVRGKKKIEVVHKAISKPYVKPDHTYKYLIFPMGFGHSGSGVILDLFSEFDNTTVFGYHDKDGSLYNKETYGEINFLRSYGGVLDLASIFHTRNSHIRDCRLQAFIDTAKSNYESFPFYNDKYKELSEKFVNNLLSYEIITENNQIVRRIKEISEKDYEKLAKKYVVGVLKSVNSKDYMVVDQFISDDNTNFDIYRKYIGNFKCIAVYRDPRDVYVTGRNFNQFWIPEDPEVFVKWYKYHTGHFINIEHIDFLLLRFEDIILDYENTLSKIFKFCCIDKLHHIRKKKYFCPDISKKNIGLYKNFHDQKAIKLIEKELSYYCFHKD